MPELPEVETVCRALDQFITHQTIKRVLIRQPALRWPIPQNLPSLLEKQTILGISRRGKYILLQFKLGTLIIHLGMSGSIRILKPPIPLISKHDHVEILFNNHLILRYRDPRRFGTILWSIDPKAHPLLATLGAEPLSNDFSGEYLFRKIAKRTAAIKTLIMNSQIVTGIGNIYANEALFAAKIHPSRPGSLLTLKECKILHKTIVLVLEKAIKAGGTTLNDFCQSDGNPGYFTQQLLVYGKANQPCPNCGQPITSLAINQRSTFFCSNCQK